MRIKRMLIVLMVFLSQSGNGQGNAAGAESAAMAGISSVLENPWSVLNNPACLAGFHHLSLNTFVEQRYLVTSVGCYALAATCPVWNGTLGIGLTYEGFQSFRDTRLSLAYGRKFANHFCGGVSLDYFNQSAGKEYTSIHQVSFTFGFAVKMSDKLSMAFSTFNPFRLYFKNHAYATLPSNYKLGLGYRPSPTMSVIAEIEKDLHYRPLFRLACKYGIRNEFFLRAGIQATPFSYSLGAGFLVRKVLIDLSTAYHQYLGFTPASSLQYLVK